MDKEFRIAVVGWALILAVIVFILSAWLAHERDRIDALSASLNNMAAEVREVRNGR